VKLSLLIAVRALGGHVGFLPPDMKPAVARDRAAAVDGADGADRAVGDTASVSDRGRGPQSLVYREETAFVYGRDQVVVLCLQAHHVRLEIGDTPVEQTNLLEHARVSASKVP
jgi:hypothetical protein